MKKSTDLDSGADTISVAISTLFFGGQILDEFLNMIGFDFAKLHSAEFWDQLSVDDHFVEHITVGGENSLLEFKILCTKLREPHLIRSESRAFGLCLFLKRSNKVFDFFIQPLI